MDWENDEAIITVRTNVHDPLLYVQNAMAEADALCIMELHRYTKAFSDLQTHWGMLPEDTRAAPSAFRLEQVSQEALDASCRTISMAFDTADRQCVTGFH